MSISLSPRLLPSASPSLARSTLGLLAFQLVVGALLQDSCHFEFPAPVATTSSEATNSDLADDWKQLRSQLYKAGLSGYTTLPEDELAMLDANHSEQRGCRPSTFGELDAVEVFKNPGFALQPSDSLVDLGSGVGQAIISAVLFFNISRGLGVELSNVRFDRSCAALTRLPSVLQSEVCGERCRARAERPGRIEMRNANLLDIDLSEFTAVMMYANCFPAPLQVKLQRKLLSELPLGARVQTTDNLGWDKQLVLGGRTLALVPRVGMLIYRVEEAPPELDDWQVLAASLEKAKAAQASAKDGLGLPEHKAEL